MESASLRERKKARTRAAIASAAMKLFGARGFAAVTLAEVAAAADVAERTLFRYFPDKEELVFAEDGGVRALLEEALASRPPDEPAASAVQAAVATLASLWEDRHEEGRERRRMISASPALAARQRAKHAQYADVIAGALVARKVAARPARVLAGSAVACFDEAVSSWLDEPSASLTLQEHVRTAFAELTALLEAAESR